MASPLTAAIRSPLRIPAADGGQPTQRRPRGCMVRSAPVSVCVRTSCTDGSTQRIGSRHRPAARKLPAKPEYLGLPLSPSINKTQTRHIWTEADAPTRSHGPFGLTRSTTTSQCLTLNLRPIPPVAVPPGVLGGTCAARVKEEDKSQAVALQAHKTRLEEGEAGRRHLITFSTFAAPIRDMSLRGFGRGQTGAKS